MANRSVCAACMRGLRQQIAECRPTSRTQLRALATSTRLGSQKKTNHAGNAKQAYQAPVPKQTPTGAAPKLDERKPAASLARLLREKAPSVTETYVAYGACEILVKECCRVAEYTIPEDQRKAQLIPDKERGVDVGVGKGWWYEKLGLTPNFNTWAQVTFLHMWLLTVRLRKFPAAHAPAWHQHLTDHFFYLAEEKMVEFHGLSVRGVRNRYLKDLFVQWRGLTAAYDQGIVEGDAMLAAAIWRNVCSGDPNVDLEKLAMVTSYVRSVLKGLEGIEDEDIARGEVVFEDPSGEGHLVRQKSGLWSRPFDQETKPPTPA